MSQLPVLGKIQFLFLRKMKKLILIFLNFSICNHNPTRSEIEAGKNKWVRPKKIPPSDTVEMTGEYWYSITSGYTSGISDIVDYNLPAGYETMIISGYQMMFPTARVIRIRKLGIVKIFVQAFCESKGMSLPIPENEAISNAVHQLSVKNIGKCWITKGLGADYNKVWLIQYELPMGHRLWLTIIWIDDVWLGIEWDSKSDTWTNIYTNQTINYDNFISEKLIKPYAKPSLNFHFQFFV